MDFGITKDHVAVRNLYRVKGEDRQVWGPCYWLWRKPNGDIDVKFPGRSLWPGTAHLIERGKLRLEMTLPCWTPENPKGLAP